MLMFLIRLFGFYCQYGFTLSGQRVWWLCVGETVAQQPYLRGKPEAVFKTALECRTGEMYKSYWWKKNWKDTQSKPITTTIIIHHNLPCYSSSLGLFFTQLLTEWRQARMGSVQSTEQIQHTHTHITKIGKLLKTDFVKHRNIEINI